MVMEIENVSGELLFRLDGGETIRFSATSRKEPLLPTNDQLNKKITGVQLSYELCGEQAFGADGLRSAFGAEDRGIITKVPDGFEVKKEGYFFVLKVGEIIIHPEMYNMARNFGIVGYWDFENLIFIASEKYEPILRNTLKFMQPNKAKFNYKSVFGGRNLLILNVQ